MHEKTVSGPGARDASQYMAADAASSARPASVAPRPAVEAPGTPPCVEQCTIGSATTLRQPQFPLLPPPQPTSFMYKTLDGGKCEAFKADDLEPIERVPYEELMRSKHAQGRPCILAALIGSAGKRHFYSLDSAMRWLTLRSTNPLTNQPVAVGETEYYAALPQSRRRLRYLCTDADLADDTKAGRFGTSLILAERGHDPVLGEFAAAVAHSDACGAYVPTANADVTIAFNALALAVACGAADAVRRLFKPACPQVNELYYLMALAVSSGEPNIAKAMFKEVPIDLDASLTPALHSDLLDSNGGTLLSLAVRHRHSDVVRLLISLGANPTLPDHLNISPLQYAKKDTDVHRALTKGIAMWRNRAGRPSKIA